MLVEVCEVTEVKPHGNADLLELCVVKGWVTAVKKNQFKAGDKCVYFPPDCVLPVNVADRLGVTKYLKTLPQGWTPRDDNEQPLSNIPPLAGRVAAARLRGSPSEGVIMPLDPKVDPDWPVGTSVAEHFNVYKWVPPLKCTDGDAERPHTRFHKYTDIESYGNFPDAIPIGTEVVFTEKLHGKNCRVGLISESDETGNQSWRLMAGSRDVRRRQFNKEGKEAEFWQFGATQKIRDMLTWVKDEFPWHEPKMAVVVFGEIFGSGVQDMTYGLANGCRSFRVFDIAINGKYIDFDMKAGICKRFDIDMVPILYRGPFSVEKMREFTDGPTTICPTDKLTCKFKGREGIVVTPVVEQIATSLNGRMIIKSVSVDYRDRRGATDESN
jgi:RNA ligase (TIGR02306 family)